MRFLSLLTFLSTALALSSPPSGAKVVTKSPASGQYSTIQAAINSLSTSSTTAQVIFIYSGTYTEQVLIPALKSTLTIYGQTNSPTTYTGNTVTLTYSKSAADAGSNDLSGTLRVKTTVGFKLYNVNVANTYGAGSQAIAVAAYGAKQGYYGCALTGYQDTLLAQTGTQVYARSQITGKTDFIFGQYAQAWFAKNDIRVLAGGGYITASGRSSSDNVNWYVLDQCTVAAASGQTVTAGSYYLGRPWGEYARVTVQKTSLSAVINSAGWRIWNTGDERTGHVAFTEYANTGTGASGTRASFSSKLSSAISVASILGSDYASWVDTSYL